MTPQPCHSHVCCGLLQIWPMLDVWAENGAYGLCRIGWRYNEENLYFSWSYMIVAMIWNTYELSASHLSHATAMFVVDCCLFGPSWRFGLKMELMACAYLVGGNSDQICIFPDLIWYYQWYKHFLNCLHYTSAMSQSFLLLIAANLALAGCLGWKWGLWPVPT